MIEGLEALLHLPGNVILTLEAVILGGLVLGYVRINRALRDHDRDCQEHRLRIESRMDAQAEGLARIEGKLE